MVEYLLLKSLLNKALFDKYSKYVSTISNKELQKVYHSLRELQKGSKEEYSVDELELSFYSDYPALKESEKELASILFRRIKEAEPDPLLIEGYLKSLKDREDARSIAVSAIEVSEGRKPISVLIEALYKLEVDDPIIEEIKYVTSDLNELYDTHASKVGLRWRLKCLNQSLGSLRKGDFGFLFARPETGKTSFLASEISYMASQLEDDSGPILWFNNEEQGQKVMRRVYSATLGKTEKEIFADRDTHYQEYLALTKDKIRIVDEASLTKNYIEKICREVNPSLIIFDQIDKIKGFDADRNDLVLGKVYQWARELAKTYAPVIAVCQADGTGEGVKWLTMGHVADAKTAKQAEADWILGIGKTHEVGFDFMRFINISKNKLTGDEDSLPEERHGRYDVIIKPDIARYEDIGYA